MPYKTIAAVGGQFATGLLNNVISQQNAEDQRDWQQMMWMAQNKWNDPSHMSDLMRRAGLNPFTMTNAEPAGSAGTGAMAQTFPIESPLVALKTIAEVENLNASTGRNESETEKLYKEIAMLDLAYERGLISSDDYKAKVDAYWEAYDDKSEYDLDREKTEAGIANTKKDTDLKDSQISLNESQANLNSALEDLAVAQHAYQELQNGRYDEKTDAEIASMKADAHNKYCSALAQKAQAKYTSYLAQGYKEDHAYRKSLWVIEREILKNQQDLSLSDAQIAEVKAYFDQLYMNGPDSFGTLGQYLYDGIFGRSPVRVSAR